MTRIWTGTASVTNGDGTVVLTGDPLSASNCPPDATIVLGGATYFVASAAYGTMTVELTRDYEGTTDSDVSAEIDPMTVETSSRTALTLEYTAFNARLQLLDADGKGLFYTILGQTGANDPGPGKLARDGDWSTVTELYLDVLDAGGKSAASLIDEWAINSVITVRSIVSRAYAAYRVLAAPQDMTGWRLVSVAYVGGDGILADGEDVAVAWSPIGSLTLAFDAQVDEVADLAQFLDQDNGFSVLVSDTGDGTPGIYSLDTSASPADWIGPAVIAGLPGDPGQNVVWRTGSGAPAGGLGSNGDMYLDTATGDVYGPKTGGVWGGIAVNIIGPEGAPGDDGADGTDPGVLLTWDDGNSDADPGAGNIRADNDALDSATFLYVSKTNRAGDNIATWLAGLASSTSDVKASIILTSSPGSAQALFDLTGVTDGTGYVKLAVTAHSGATGYTAATAISLEVSKTGDAGDGAVDSVNGQSGDVVLDADDIDDTSTTHKFATAGEKTKLGHISVTQAVDLDAIETRVAALDAAVVLMGTWDASAGTFPGSGSAQAGESWIVSVAGTVNSVAFAVGDRIIAILDNASTSTFASNWFKADYTDQVSSVAGRTGAVTLAQADISGLTTASSPQFTGVNLGHASDTTLTRPSAGNLAIEGTIALKGGRQSMYVPASGMYPKATAGAGEGTYDSGSNDITIRTLDFDTTTQEYAQFEVVMPKAWDRGTVSFVPYWTNAGGSSTQTVRWTLAGVAISNDDTLNATLGTAQNSDDTWIAQNDLHVGPESSAITIGGSPAEADLVIFQISRDVANDNMAGDAVLLGVMIFFSVDKANDA